MVQYIPHLNEPYIAVCPEAVLISIPAAWTRGSCVQAQSFVIVVAPIQLSMCHEERQRPLLRRTLQRMRNYLVFLPPVP